MTAAACFNMDTFNLLLAKLNRRKLNQIGRLRLEGQHAVILLDVAHPLFHKADRLGNGFLRGIYLALIAQLIEQRKTRHMVLMAMGEENCFDLRYNFSCQRRIKANLTIHNFTLYAAIEENEFISHTDGIAVSSILAAAAESGQIHIVHQLHLCRPSVSSVRENSCWELFCAYRSNSCMFLSLYAIRHARRAMQERAESRIGRLMRRISC